MIKARIRKRDGRQVYDVRLRDPRGKEYGRTFETKRAAGDFEASERTARRRGAWVDPRHADLTFGELAGRWLAANPTKRPNTIATDEIMIRVHLETFTSRRIGSVTQPDVQALVNAWAATSAPRTVRRRYGVLRAIFEYAVKADWLGRSPCRNINLPPVTSTRRTKLDAGQVAAIADATAGEYRAMVWLGAVLGLRWEEVTGLRVGALDLLAGQVTIAETNIRDGKGRPVAGRPKSAASGRTMAVGGALVDMLAEHLAVRGLTAADEDRLLFEAPAGGPLRYSNWRRRVWLPAVTAAGCMGAGFHDLRRASATQLVAAGVDIRTAQGRLGHSDPRLTLATYAEAVEDVDRRAAETMGAVFLGARDGRGMEGRGTRSRHPG